jgi:Fe-S-cluster-containing dehydrogenase component
MAKVLVVDQDKCTGCAACEIMCSFSKNGVFNPEYSTIKVMRDEPTGAVCPLFCQHCSEPACLRACPVEGAIVRDEQRGVVLIDDEVCTGCGTCMMACPYGAISVDLTTLGRPQRKMIKCDLCHGNPKCLQWCEPGALQFIESDSENVKKWRVDLLAFKKRFEIDYKILLWRYYSKKPKSSTSL